MARIWTCGFEMQSTSANVEITSTAGGPTISTTIKRRGTASMRSRTTTATTSYAEHQLDAGTVKRTFHRFYLYVAQMPSADADIYGIGQSGYFPALVRLKTDGTLTLRDNFTSTNVGAVSAPLVTGRWYRIELDYTDVAGTLTAGVSAFRGYLDGVQFSNTTCSNINGWSRVRMGIQSAAIGDVYIDDVAVNDTNGTAQNSLPGPGCVVHLYPNAAGDANTWATAVGGTAGIANNWTRVSQRVPDDDTSYNQTIATGTTTIDDFNVGSAASAGIGTADVINCVQVAARVCSDSGTAASIVVRLKGAAGGTVVESSSISVATITWQTHQAAAPRVHKLTSYTNPSTGTAWTAAALENAQVGYRSNVSQTTVRRVTSLFIAVDFVPRFALGAASTTSTAHALGYTKAARPVSALVDDFNDGVVNTTLWPNSYGDYSEVGGKAHVAINTGYNAYSSAKAYVLKDSALVFQINPPASMPDGATEAWAQVLIKSNVEGTDLGFELSVATGLVAAFVRTGYWDPEGVYLPYDANAHRWMRIRETGGQVMWDTAPDGHTWTNRRTITSPDWVDDGDLEIQMIAHRADGVNNYVDYDNVNVLPLYVAPLNPASSSNFGRVLTAFKRGSIGKAATAQTAHSVRVVKRVRAGVAGVTNTARALTPSKTRGLGAATNGVSAMALMALRQIPLLSGSVVGSGLGLALEKTRKLGTLARTADQASPTTTLKRGFLASAGVGVASHAVRALKAASTGRAQVANSAHKVGPAKSGEVAHAAAIDTAHPVLVRKTTFAGAAATDTISWGLVARHRAQAAPAVSQAAGRPLVARKRGSLGPVATAETAHPATARTTAHLQRATDAASGRPVTARKYDPRSTPAAAVEAATSLTPHKRLALGVALQADAARPPAGSVKTLRVGVATSTHSGGGAEFLKRSGLGSAQQSSTAHALDADKLRRIGLATQVSIARAVTWKHSVRVGAASTGNTGHEMTPAKTRHLVNSAVANLARGVAVRKTRSLDQGTAHEVGSGIRPVKHMALGVAREQSVARGVSMPVLNRLLRTASAVERANQITVYKQRPADKLVPGWTEPGLTPGTSSTGLKTSTSGPTLITSTTSGGS